MFLKQIFLFSKRKDYNKNKTLKHRVIGIFDILKINMYKHLGLLFIKIFLMNRSYSIQGHGV